MLRLCSGEVIIYGYKISVTLTLHYIGTYFGTQKRTRREYVKLRRHYCTRFYLPNKSDHDIDAPGRLAGMADTDKPVLDTTARKYNSTDNYWIRYTQQLARRAPCGAVHLHEMVVHLPLNLGQIKAINRHVCCNLEEGRACESLSQKQAHMRTITHGSGTRCAS